MKYAFNSLCGMAALALGMLLSFAHASADFNLTIDSNTLRQAQSGIWEIDTTIESVGTPATIQTILLSLRIEPGAGQPATATDGVQFVGLRNPDNNALLSPIEVTSEITSRLFLSGSLINAAPVDAPAAPHNAFTLQFLSNRNDPTTVKIEFLVAFFEKNKVNGGEPQISSFALLRNSSNLTITGVPEPSSYVLAALALTGVALSRRRKKLRMAAAH